MFLYKFSRGEEVIKAGGRVRCTISNGTCSYEYPASANATASLPQHGRGNSYTPFKIPQVKSSQLTKTRTFPAPI